VGPLSARQLLYLGTTCNSFWTMTVDSNTQQINRTDPSFLVATFGATDLTPSATYGATGSSDPIPFTIAGNGNDVVMFYDPTISTSSVRSGWIGVRSAVTCGTMMLSDALCIHIALHCCWGRCCSLYPHRVRCLHAVCCTLASLSLVTARCVDQGTLSGDRPTVNSFTVSYSGGRYLYTITFTAAVC